MVKQIIPRQPKPRKVIISTEFVISLARVKDYGEELFGREVSDKFVREIRQKVSLLAKQPDANPLSRFIESTKKKTYRNIIHKRYCVLYSVTVFTIDIIDIYHSARSPEFIKELLPNH
ncbi:hypothetical protein FACS1894176_02100 [Bacteroidia bacterium]|nr:hypothetical protein FACS1894176_02100 [Bacteroidia bacterium]